MACVVMACVVTTDAVMALCSHGLHGYGLCSYGLCSYGLCNYGLYSCGLCGYGPYSYDLCSCGLRSYGLHGYGLRQQVIYGRPRVTVKREKKGIRAEGRPAMAPRLFAEGGEAPPDGCREERLAANCTRMHASLWARPHTHACGYRSAGTHNVLLGS